MHCKTILAVILACIFITGCYTMEGVGRDLEKAGEKVQHMSKKKADER